jgi:hypothetical protein
METPVIGSTNEREDIPRGPSVLATPSIEAVWRAAIAQLGFEVVRTTEAYATSDGKGVIAIGVDEALDPDDAFAQLVFHELCHAITQGEGAIAEPDWGLDNVPEHVVREHACLRLQAELAAPFGLRGAMAPTTSYRAYYDGLPAAPLGPGSDPAIALAVEAAARFAASSWRGPIEEALAATAALTTARHPLGFPLGPAGETCGGCAWMYVGGRGAPVPRCRQTAKAVGDGARTTREAPACARWEAPVDCQSCGACCREAYHSVTVSVRDPVVWKEPALIERHGHRFEIRREGPRCAALAVAGDAPGQPRYACTIYDNRPRPCREFAANGRHCLEARRRVGLSQGG